MVLKFPTPSSRETTTLREIAEGLIPSPDEMEGDKAGQATLRYMRGLMQAIVTENSDILDRPFDVNNTASVTEGFTRFWTGDLTDAVIQGGLDNDSLTEADLASITPDGTAHRLALDMREQIEALTSR